MCVSLVVILEYGKIALYSRWEGNNDYIFEIDSQVSLVVVPGRFDESVELGKNM